MFSNFLGSVGPLGLAFIVILGLAIVGLFAALLRDRRHPAEEPDTVFDPVHRGKANTADCKFDRDEVRRSQLLPRADIDTTNLPQPDARIQALLADVREDTIRDHLNKFTGEVDVTIGSTTGRITSRNTFTQTIDLAFAYAESIYRNLGIQVGFHNYKVRGRALRNVVAEIPGKTQPNKILLIGSHIDSTAGGTSRPEPVAPGADDDGSGCVTIFEVARALKQLSLDYTVRFVHFSGEEQGLWGSYAYSDVVAKEGKEIIGLLQIDMVGYSKSETNRVDIHDGRDRNGSHFLVAELTRQVKRYGLKLAPYDTHNHAMDDRSDHAGFLDHGYKAVLISAEFTDEAFNPNYHSTNDRVSTLNLPFMVEVIRMIIATAADLAMAKS